MKQRPPRKKTPAAPETKLVHVTKSPEWERMIRGERVPVNDHDFHAGYYMLKRGSTTIPARIWIERVIDAETGEIMQDEKICCTIDGARQDERIAQFWLYMKPINPQTYALMMKAPNREAPGKRVALKDMPPII